MSSKRVNLAKGTPVDALCEEMDALTVDCNDVTARAAQLGRFVRLVSWTSAPARARIYESLSKMTIRLGGTNHKRFTRYQRNQLNAAFDAVAVLNDNVTLLSQRQVALQAPDAAQSDSNRASSGG